MRNSNRFRKSIPPATVTIGIAILVAGNICWSRDDPPRILTSSPSVMRTDDLQRSVKLDTYKVIANSGAERGENIYFYQCWMCHNQYAKSAPYLKDLFKRTQLMSGDAVTDQNVAAKINEGGPGMPSFRTTLTPPDIADLLAYIKEGKCCVEGENPAANPWYRAAAQNWPVQSGLFGGPTGVVRITSGDSPEGVGVQLVAPNGVRTTVYSDEHGHFEFPRMQTGNYILRLPTPLLFKPYRIDSVHVDGASKLDEIVVERVSNTEGLPATPEIERQLSGAELLWNLPGTGEEKATFQKECSACHSWQQIFRNRYDERSWGLIVDRMTHYTGTSLVVRMSDQDYHAAGTDDNAEIITKWLARVRGPTARDTSLRMFPRPRGASTRVIITEYELPQALLALHDVQPDSKGNLWFSSHKTQFVGKLDPRTGIVTEYKIPLTPNAMPGTHAVVVDKDDTIWFSENWAHNLTKLDPQSGKVTQVRIEETSRPLNVPAFGNFAMTSDGYVWDSMDGYVRKIDSETGKIVRRYPLQANFSYDSLISADGKFWAGGGPPHSGNTAERLDIRTGQWINLNTGAHMATAKRGGFDPYGNPWFGGGDGALIELNAKSGLIEEYVPPTAPSPLTDFYEAMPDKNGEVWAGVLHGRQIVRFNPITDVWAVYQMPEPFSYDRRTYIDSSTHPVTVWYVDYNGYVVRIQPRE